MYLPSPIWSLSRASGQWICQPLKTMERMINDRLVWFLESNNLISGNQAGFRKNYSTNDHLVRLESLICDAFVKKEHCVAIFF